MPQKQEIKIMIVDDSITVRELMKHQLKEFGIQHIQEAKNGQEAITVFKNFSPDITFLDINMPQLNGVEALSKILEINPKAYVIMLSSMGTKEKINQTLSIGAKNFLMKPIENENLERIISEITEQ